MITITERLLMDPEFKGKWVALDGDNVLGSAATLEDLEVVVGSVIMNKDGMVFLRVGS